MIKIVVLLVLTAVMLTALIDRSASTAPETDAYGPEPTGLGQVSGQELTVTGDDRAGEILAIVALGAGFTVIAGGRAYLAGRPRPQHP